MTVEEAKKIVLAKVGVEELPEGIRANWEELPTLCQLHGAEALDGIVDALRWEMANRQ